MRSNGFVVAVLASSTAGCSSSYVPAASPRLSLIMEGGTYAFVRDGKKYEGGVTGGDIEEAVQGSPKAEEYAHEYKTGMTTGFAMTILGAAAAVGGLTLFGVQAAHQTSGDTLPPAGLLVASGGLIVELIGVAVASNALPHLFDAINAYNDALRASGDAPSAGR